MEAGHEDEGGARQTADQFWPDLDDLAQTGPDGRLLLALHWISQAWQPMHLRVSWVRWYRLMKILL